MQPTLDTGRVISMVIKLVEKERLKMNDISWTLLTFLIGMITMHGIYQYPGSHIDPLDGECLEQEVRAFQSGTDMRGLPLIKSDESASD